MFNKAPITAKPVARIPKGRMTVTGLFKAISFLVFILVTVITVRGSLKFCQDDNLLWRRGR